MTITIASTFEVAIFYLLLTLGTVSLLALFSIGGTLLCYWLKYKLF